MSLVTLYWHLNPLGQYKAFQKYPDTSISFFTLCLNILSLGKGILHSYFLLLDKSYLNKIWAQVQIPHPLPSILHWKQPLFHSRRRSLHLGHNMFKTKQLIVLVISFYFLVFPLVGFFCQLAVIWLLLCCAFKETLVFSNSSPNPWFQTVQCMSFII